MKLQNSKKIWKIFEEYFQNRDFEFMDLFGKREVDTEDLKAKLLECASCCTKAADDIETLEKSAVSDVKKKAS